MEGWGRLSLTGARGGSEGRERGAGRARVRAWGAGAGAGAGEGRGVSVVSGWGYAARAAERERGAGRRGGAGLEAGRRGALEICSRMEPHGLQVAQRSSCSPGVVGSMHTP